MSDRPNRHTLLRTDAEIDALARRIETAPADTIVAHDTETGASRELMAVFGDKAALYPWAGSYATGISVCVVDPFLSADAGLDGFYVPVGHKVGNASGAAVRRLCGALARTEAVHLLHHANFDWDVLEHLDKGYRPSPRTVDTQVVRWLMDENQPKALKVLGEQFLGEDASREQRELKAVRAAPYAKIGDAKRAVATAFPELFHWSKAGNPVRPLPEHAYVNDWIAQLRKARSWGEITVEEMYPYAARDATMTAEIGDMLIGFDAIVKPNSTIAREMELQPILHHMTKQGVGVHVDQLQAAGLEYEQRAVKIADEYEAAFGSAMRKRFGRTERINLGSPDQMSWLLYDHVKLPVKLRTPGGDPSTDKNALEMLEGNAVAKGVLDYRRWTKARTAYADAFSKFAERSPDGRIHGHFSSVGTVTGRLAASGPNVMTLPREDSLPEIRAAFTKTEPGYVRIGFDLASAELWVTAAITQDPVLTATLQEGRNLHLETMISVFGGEADKHRREYTLSKNVNYGIEYGAGIDQIAKFAAKAGYGPTEAYEVANRIRNGHKRLFARQHFVSDFLADKARELGKLPLAPPGRYRHFLSPGVAVGYYTALNALVQGGVAEFMKDTMLELFRRGKFGELLILQVHDELVFDAPDEPGIADAIHAELTEISGLVNPFRYPLTWEGKQW